MNKKVLIIATHPDDEVLGCGGTILKHKYNGDLVNILFISSGNKFQKKSIRLVCEFLNVDFQCLNFQDMYVQDLSLNTLIPEISRFVHKFKPNVIYVPNRSDAHSDHRRTFEAIIPITKTFRYPFIREIYMCNIHSETDLALPLIENYFQKNYFVDISDFWDAKIKAMKFYGSEIINSPSTRSLDSIRALDSYNGSLICVKYAEVYQLLKKIDY